MAEAPSNPTDGDAPTMRVGGETASDERSTRPLAPPSGAFLPNVPPKLGPYDLIQVIGRGGMGIVYKAMHEKLRTLCAVKVLIAGEHASPEEIARFQREAAAVARMGKHPNIVTVYDLGEQGNLAYYAMELAEGKSLRTRIEEASFAPKETAALLEKVARALHFAHERGIVHRDMKPDNIMVRPDGEPQVMDFGLARDAESTQRLSLSGQIMGTLAYMAPEQARGDVEHQDARTDVYAMGAILYEMLTGISPHAGKTAAEMLPLIVRGEIVPPRRHRPDVPRDLETICLKCLELLPERRYASALVLAEDLARFRRGDPILARPVSPLASIMRKASRHRAVVIPSAIAAVLGLGFLAYALVSRATLAKAKDDRSEMERRLEEAELVSRVWGRWLTHTTTVDAIESAHYDYRLSPEDKRKRAEPLWQEIDRFMEETPKDDASQATMKALAGWCRRLAGHEDEGLAWMREAAKRRPEIPYGSLLEALVWFADYVELQPMPTVGMAAGQGVHFGTVPPESEGMAELRGRIERLLPAIDAARIWGKGAAEQFAGALAAMRAFQAEKTAEAEAGLTQALAAPDLAPFRTHLLVARAKARYLLQRFDDAIRDLEEARRLRDGRADVFAYLGLMRMARSIVGDARGEDPRPLLEQALGDFQAALARNPNDAPTYNSRAHAYKALGAVEEARGDDPREDYRRGIADLGSALDLSKESGTYHNRGLLLSDLAEAETARGGDPTEPLQKAIVDYGNAIRLAPDSMESYINRSDAYCLLGQRELELGQDPRGEITKGIDDGEAALRLAPDSIDARRCRGAAFARLGQAEISLGEDGWGTLGKAIADFDAVIAASPEDVLARGFRGEARTVRAMVMTSRGEDARSELRDGVADLDVSIAKRPGDVLARFARASSLRRLADAETAAGGDARETSRKAIADFDAILASQPDYPGATSSRGDAHLALAEAEAAHGGDARGSYGKARADYEAALRPDPQNGVLLANLGQALEGLGEYEKAVDAYRRALAILGDGVPVLKEYLARAEKKLQPKQDPK